MSKFSRRKIFFLGLSVCGVREWCDGGGREERRRGRKKRKKRTEQKGPVGQAVEADLRKPEQTPSSTLGLCEGVPIDVDLNSSPATSRHRRKTADCE